MKWSDPYCNTWTIQPFPWKQEVEYNRFVFKQLDIEFGMVRSVPWAVAYTALGAPPPRAKLSRGPRGAAAPRSGAPKISSVGLLDLLTFWAPFEHFYFTHFHWCGSLYSSSNQNMNIPELGMCSGCIPFFWAYFEHDWTMRRTPTTQFLREAYNVTLFLEHSEPKIRTWCTTPHTKLLLVRVP